MVIFLIGFMGCGKSTIGRKVANRLNYDFMDFDSVIEQRSGMTISELFAQIGEAEFRRLESGLIDEMSAEGNVIVATGGGAPCFGDNMARMNAKGKTVYFKMTPQQLALRLVRGRAKRPKIAGMNDEELLDFIETTLVDREKFYSQAKIVIDCNGVSDDYIAEHLAYCVDL